MREAFWEERTRDQKWKYYEIIISVLFGGKAQYSHADRYVCLDSHIFLNLTGNQSIQTLTHSFFISKQQMGCCWVREYFRDAFLAFYLGCKLTCKIESSVLPMWNEFVFGLSPVPSGQVGHITNATLTISTNGSTLVVEAKVLIGLEIELPFQPSGDVSMPRDFNGAVWGKRSSLQCWCCIYGKKPKTSVSHAVRQLSSRRNNEKIGKSYNSSWSPIHFSLP